MNLGQISKLVDIESWGAKNHRRILRGLRGCSELPTIRLKLSFLSATIAESAGPTEMESALREISYDIWQALQLSCTHAEVHRYCCIWFDELVKEFHYEAESFPTSRSPD